jgi:NAD dependent epimerase/dehydratase family enzyme
MSWIHRDDLISMILWAAAGDVKGAMNAVAPEPVRNSDFSRALGGAVRRPAVLPVPEFALKLMFGEMASVLLASARVVPETAQQHGFKWRFDSLEAALADAVLN